MSAAFPSAPVSFPSSRARSPSGGTAEILVLVALILQVIGGLIVLGGIGYLFGFSILFPFPYAWAAVTAAAVVAILVIVFLYYAYTTSYSRIRSGDYQGAQTPTLVIGILSLFLGLIPGIFYLIGYVKLSDAVREQQAGGPGQSGYVPGSLMACKGCGRVFPAGSFAFCPSCGLKLGA